jgi:hypothetical protein
VAGVAQPGDEHAHNLAAPITRTLMKAVEAA